ncbi:MAG: hypothetical protein V3U62_02865, partial [Sedimenticolaceae bacterium]
TTSLSEEKLASARRDHIDFVFQSFHLIPRLTAAENVELPLMLAGIEPKERHQRVHQVFEALGMVGCAATGLTSSPVVKGNGGRCHQNPGGTEPARHYSYCGHP